MARIIKNGFDLMKAAELINTARSITDSMRANVALFADPNPDLNLIDNATDALEQLDIEAKSGDRYKISLRKQKQQEVIDLLRQEGNYVEMIANGDHSIALAAGMPTVKEREPKPAIQFVPTPVAKAGIEGQVASRGKKVEGAAMYAHAITADVNLPKSQWSITYSTKTSMVYYNLESGKRFFICMAALGKNEQYVFSDYVTIIAP